MNARRLVIFVFVLIVLVNFVSAYDLDLRITATANGLSGSFNAITNPSAENGFDGYDAANTPLPSNYIYVYSNITPDAFLTSGQLALDAWNQSGNPRILTLNVQVNPSVSAVPLVLSWAGSSFTGFDVTLKDYGSTNRVSVVSTVNMTTQNSYTVSSFTGTNRYFTIEVVNSTAVVDTTPPGPVTGLNYISKGNNYINWGWTNPTDSDFSEVIIYLNDINVVNTTLTRYNATSLYSNTSYTIRINTKDLSGNVNTVNVNNIQITNPAGTVPIVNPTLPPAGTTPGLPVTTNTNTQTGTNGIPIIGGDSGESVGNGTGNQSSSSNVFNLAGKVGLVYGLIGVGIVIVIVIAVILIRIIRRSAKHQHHIEKHLKHIHRERIKLMKKKRL